MKLGKTSWLGLVCCFAFFFSCSNQAEKPKGVGEPNNSIMEAGIIESGKSYTMKIDSIGDIDWYALPVSDSGYVRISTKIVPENLKLNVRFAEKEEWKQEKEKWLTKWLNVPSTIAVRGIDTLYFVISDDYDDSYSEESFEFKVDFIKEFDKYEPNETPDFAKEVISGEVINSFFFPNNDEDWFKIQADTTGYLVLRSRKVPDGVNVNARFAWKESEFDEVKYLSKWQDLPAAIQVTKPGTYYFVLIDDYHDNMSEDAAEWKIDLIPEMDVTEPNNSPAQAYKTAIGETVTHFIFPKGDVDYFTFYSGAAQTVLISANSPDEINLNVRLHVQGEMETEVVSKYQALPTKLELEANRNYFLEVIDEYNDQYSEKPISISIQKTDNRK